MQNSNSNAGTEVPQSDAAEVTTSSQTIAKPLVGGSTFKQRPKKFRFWLGHTKKMTYEHSFSEISKIIPNFTDDIIPLEFTGLKDSRNVNIYEGDSLKADYNKEFGINHFDIIIGNPPYNASGTKASGNTIWQLFVNNCIKITKNEGYMCFIHPNGWRKPNTEKGKFYGLFENDPFCLY